MPPLAGGFAGCARLFDNSTNQFAFVILLGILLTCNGYLNASPIAPAIVEVWYVTAAAVGPTYEDVYMAVLTVSGNSTQYVSQRSRRT